MEDPSNTFSVRESYMMQQSLGKRLSSLKVGQKIGLGYTLALGIAVSGTIVGFGLGHHYQQQTEQQEERARNEVELLHRLQSRVLQTRTHQQQLIPLTQYPEKFQDEYAHLVKHKAEIKIIWAELKEFVTKSPLPKNYVDRTKIPGFLETYDHIPQLYSQELERRVEKIQTLNLALPTDVEQAQNLIMEFTNSDLALKFDGISDDLVDLIDEYYKELQVTIGLHEQASQVAAKVVGMSIGLSVAIAIILAVVTSKAIAKPIESLTVVAKRATEESNFDLQATIEQDDEIGMLANAFNQLIGSVKKLLDRQKTANEQLENYSQTLELKVDERTKELNDKNTQLQELLAELQRTQVQMVQSEKMSALGQMVAGVAHEINNPVNFIHGNLTYVQEYAQNLLGFVELYQKHYPDPAPEIKAEAEEVDLEFVQADLLKVIDSLKVGTERIRQIVLSLRNFSRTDEADFKAVDIHEGINSTLLILQHRLKDRPDRPGIQVICDYGNLPPVECYPGQINQVFMNILANAIDALEEANIKRTYQELKKNPNLITIRTSMIDSNWIEIAISDNALGMSEAVKKRIFDPFFTTKSVGKGTGLGMPISYQIVTEKHGGKLDCFSRLGEGTELSVIIPVKQQTLNPKPSAVETPSCQTQSANED